MADEYGTILRLEVRLSRDTICKYVRQLNLYELKEILSCFIYDSQDIMKDCIERSFWQGGFATLETAKRIISLQPFKGKTKEHMFNILDSRKPIEERFDDLTVNYNYSSKQILRLKNKFKKCNICPVSQIRNQKVAFFLHGKSNSGKSVMLDLMKKIVGEEFCSSVSFEQLASRFGTSLFLGKTLNVSGEAPDITAKRLDTFKTIVGNDAITAEHKGKDGFHMRNYALLIFAANNMPEISIPDEAYYNRLRIIRYNKSADKSMWINNLPERLYKESLGTILRFAVEGLKRFIDNGMELTYIETSDRYVDEYRNDANSFISFITQFVKCESNGILLSKDLFGAYIEYCSQNMLKPIGTNKCSKMLLEVFPEAEKSTSGHSGNKCYKGLKCTYPIQKI